MSIKFVTAVKHLMPRQKARRKNWRDKVYLYLTPVKHKLKIHWENGERQSAFYGLSAEDMDADDWYIQATPGP